nr:hypothetical protein [Tanacetum cinerariifolium]
MNLDNYEGGIFPPYWVKVWGDYSADYKNDDPIPFRRRVFSSIIDGKPVTGKMLESKIKSENLYRLNDHDVVCLCCVAILQFVLLGLEDRRKVPYWILRLANDREAHDYFKRERHYPIIVAWRAKKKFFRNMLRGFFILTLDEFEARSDWWVSSRAFFDGHISEAARIPRHVNRKNEDDVPSDFYREFEEQKKGAQ